MAGGVAAAAQLQRTVAQLQLQCPADVGPLQLQGLVVEQVDVAAALQLTEAADRQLQGIVAAADSAGGDQSYGCTAATAQVEGLAVGIADAAAAADQAQFTAAHIDGGEAQVAAALQIQVAADVDAAVSRHRQGA